MKFLSFYKTRLCILVALITMVLSAVITFLSVYALQRTVTDVFGSRAAELLSYAVELVDENELKAFLKNPDEDSAWFKNTQKQMNLILESSGAEQLYCSRLVEGTLFSVVMDATNCESEDYSPFGTEEDVEGYEREPLLVLETGEMQISKIAYTEEWGWTQSAYYPLKIDGKTVGSYS